MLDLIFDSAAASLDELVIILCGVVLDRDASLEMTHLLARW